MRYQVVVRESQVDEQFVVYAPDVVGCSASGRTREEALQRLRARLREDLEAPSSTELEVVT